MELKVKRYRFGEFKGEDSIHIRDLIPMSELCGDTLLGFNVEGEHSNLFFYADDQDIDVDTDGVQVKTSYAITEEQLDFLQSITQIVEHIDNRISDLDTALWTSTIAQDQCLNAWKHWKNKLLDSEIEPIVSLRCENCEVVLDEQMKSSNPKLCKCCEGHSCLKCDEKKDCNRFIGEKK